MTRNIIFLLVQSRILVGNEINCFNLKYKKHIKIEILKYNICIIYSFFQKLIEIHKYMGAIIYIIYI